MRLEKADNICVWCWNELDGEIVDLGRAQAHKACDDRMNDFVNRLGEWTE